MNHTPTPWTLARPGTDRSITVTFYAPDAPFIVRACNSHNALVATLEDLLDEISGCGLVFKGYIDADSVKTAKTALKLAKGE